jgi:hypothetical protein
MTVAQWMAGMVAVAWALAACSSTDSDSSGAAGTGAQAGSGAAAGAGGSAAGAAGAADSRAQAATYARDDLPCTQDSDCCVVFDSCLAQGYLVAASDKTVVSGLLAAADRSACVNCIPPPIEAWCNAGICKAVKITCTNSFPSDAMQSHCGKVSSLPSDCTTGQDAPGLQPPGLQPQTILGC